MGMASGRFGHIMDWGQYVRSSVDESLDGKAVLQHWCVVPSCISRFFIQLRLYVQLAV
jgi:hypothetical protein